MTKGRYDEYIDAKSHSNLRREGEQRRHLKAEEQ
jgi:hypothetical protein